MKRNGSLVRITLPLAALGAACWVMAATPQVAGLVRQSNGEVTLTSTADAGAYYRIESSEDAQTWTPFVTVQSTGTDQLVDTASRLKDRRFYRAVPLTGTGIFTGDHLQTSAGDAILHPVNHAAVAVSWNGKMLYSDPGSTGSLYTNMPRADVIVVTHTHGDHYSNAVLEALLDTDGVIFAPMSVYNMMPSVAPALLRSKTTVLANGATGTAHGMTVRAVPMYNMSNMNHPQGIGNGYVVTLGGKNVYFSGDTEDIPEMRALTGIDAAFVCMSLPSNMTVDDAADAVLEFKPGMVFPYHYRQGATTFDTGRFKQLVSADPAIQVRLRAFY
ncbi:MAG TPA: MBL fold metallo-hydrolase [Verrucomicrobiales bacterium]|jgi:L-ascorbate metabolism protein UlaG (beta-lactamase superfamily)|nr:MBL fold metallo-hydrolase [Verrucomicrobiales bacterium]